MRLSITNLNKSYDKKQVLKNVNFDVEYGRTLGLLGRNGQGKSTIMKIIMGIITSNSGQVTIDGVDIAKSDLKLGYLPEERGLYPKRKIIEQIIYFGKLRGLTGVQAKSRANELIEKLELTEYTNQKAATLSKGNQQKVQLAIAMVNDPDIIILDEPYSGLDPVNSRLLQKLIEEASEQNKIILFSSHQLGTVEEFCRDICIINHGEVLLTGNLQTIKNAYPKNKLLFVPEPNQTNRLTQTAQGLKNENHCENYENTEQGLIVWIKNEDTKNTVISRIMTNVQIESFGVVKPTLLEIFLEKVETTTGVEE